MNFVSLSAFCRIARFPSEIIEPAFQCQTDENKRTRLDKYSNRWGHWKSREETAGFKFAVGEINCLAIVFRLSSKRCKKYEFLNGFSKEKNGLDERQREMGISAAHTLHLRTFGSLSGVIFVCFEIFHFPRAMQIGCSSVQCSCTRIWKSRTH